MFDYMAGVRRIPISLAVELWGTGDGDDKGCFDLFNPPSKDLATELARLRPLYDVLFHRLAFTSPPPLSVAPESTSKPQPNRASPVAWLGIRRLLPVAAAACFFLVSNGHGENTTGFRGALLLTMCKRTVACGRSALGANPRSCAPFLDLRRCLYTPRMLMSLQWKYRGTVAVALGRVCTAVAPLSVRCVRTTRTTRL